MDTKGLAPRMIPVYDVGDITTYHADCADLLPDNQHPNSLTFGDNLNAHDSHHRFNTFHPRHRRHCTRTVHVSIDRLHRVGPHQHFVPIRHPDKHRTVHGYTHVDRHRHSERYYPCLYRRLLFRHHHNRARFIRDTRSRRFTSRRFCGVVVLGPASTRHHIEKENTWQQNTRSPTDGCY